MTTLLILVTITGAIGATLVFVGTLVAMLTAVGNRAYWFGVGIFVFFPLGILYCVRNWERAAYPGKMLIGGSILLVISLAVGWQAYLQLLSKISG